MSHLNIEIKAHCENLAEIRNILNEQNALFKGTDRQVDTYFNCQTGKLKLREGQIESHLIHYNREQTIAPKKSLVTLYQSNNNSNLKEILTNALGVLAVVTKQREIYFIDNIKFHLDTVDGLGSFVEIEAIDTTGTIGASKLREQCEEYIKAFDIQSHSLIHGSYGDMLLELRKI